MRIVWRRFSPAPWFEGRVPRRRRCRLLAGAPSSTAEYSPSRINSCLQESSSNTAVVPRPVRPRLGFGQVPEDPDSPAGATRSGGRRRAALNRRSAASPRSCWPEDRVQRPRTYASYAARSHQWNRSSRLVLVRQRARAGRAAVPGPTPNDWQERLGCPWRDSAAASGNLPCLVKFCLADASSTHSVARRDLDKVSFRSGLCAHDLYGSSYAPCGGLYMRRYPPVDARGGSGRVTILSRPSTGHAVEWERALYSS